jgi:hypothetical protein
MDDTTRSTMVEDFEIAAHQFDQSITFPRNLPSLHEFEARNYLSTTDNQVRQDNVPMDLDFTVAGASVSEHTDHSQTHHTRMRPSLLTETTDTLGTAEDRAYLLRHFSCTPAKW